MQKNIIKYAINKTTQKVDHIDNVANGLACDCVCAECNNEMEAIQGEKKEWHFRHHINSKCKGGLETAIHKLAKEIIVKNNKIALPHKIPLLYTEPIAEKPFEDIIPDVSAISDNKPLFIEIFVCHRCDPEKEEFYKTKQINSFEIDLSQISYTITEKELEELILSKTDNKRYLFWNNQEVIPVKDVNKNTSNTWLGIVVIFLIGLLFFKRK